MVEEFVLGSSNMTDKSLHIDAGTYIVTIDAPAGANIKVRDTDDKLGSGGDILADGAVKVELEVKTGGDFNIRVLNMDFSGVSMTVTLTFKLK